MKAIDIFQFDKNIPPELLPRIKALVTPLVVLVPKWCQVVEVRYCAFPESNGQKESTSMTTAIAYPYRSADLVFYPMLFTRTPEQQKDDCVHEFVHISNLIVADYAKKELERLLPEDDAPKYRAAIMEGLENRVESATQDMCWIIRGLMNG